MEHEIGLRDGIFGQLAAGGNAGTFVPTQELRTKAWARQVERRNKATGTQMQRSEDLVAEVYPRWLRHIGARPDGRYAVDGPPRTQLTTDELDRVLARLDDLSSRWRAVEVGGSLSVAWPQPERA